MMFREKLLNIILGMSKEKALSCLPSVPKVPPITFYIKGNRQIYFGKSLYNERRSFFKVSKLSTLTHKMG